MKGGVLATIQAKVKKNGMSMGGTNLRSRISSWVTVNRLREIQKAGRAPSKGKNRAS